MRLIVMMLAAWRLSSLLVQEDGPARVFAHVRARTSLWGVLECLWCASVWVALLVLVLERIAPRLVDVLAISAGAIAVDRWNSS